MLSGSMRVMSGPPFSSLIPEWGTPSRSRCCAQASRVAPSLTLNAKWSSPTARSSNASLAAPSWANSPTDTAWVVHAPAPKFWSFDLEDRAETEDFSPPSCAALRVCHGEIDVSEAFDSRGGHGDIVVLTEHGALGKWTRSRSRIGCP